VLVAGDVSVDLGGRTILEPTSIELSTGRFVALIGPSGAGKSTLLRVLAGVSAPSAGTITIGDVPLARRTDTVGYVPFGDLLHERLTVREALTYVAALRAVPDAAERVEAVLDELSLTGRGDSRIDSLSGGERRRAAVGTELLGQPAVLLLDEPATGLDARLERRLMELLRELADDGRAVVVATHATASLELCDDIAVMGPGGRLRFLGPPEELLDHFGIASYERVYELLESEPRARQAERPGPMDPRPGPALAPERVAPLPAQSRILASRYRLTLLRDRRTLAVLLGQAPLIGAAIGLALPAAVLERPVVAGYFAVMLGFLLTVGSLWLGVISSCREVVKEKEIVYRELATGVRMDAYLAAKCLVLFPLTALQVIAMALVVALIQPLGVGAAGMLGLTALCVLTAWAAVALGLWVSVVARSADQATSAVPLVLIPQLLLAGAIIPVAEMSAPAKAGAALALSRWSFGGIGNLLDIDVRLTDEVAATTGFEASFFTVPPVRHALALVAFVLLTLAIAGAVLDRRAARAQLGR
jgi:ABC-type multidrug transport system ATPase subunit